jgi:hypothetical protein
MGGWNDDWLEAAYESAVTGDYDEPAQPGWDYDDEEDDE